VLTSNGSGGIVAESTLTFNGTTNLLGVSGYQNIVDNSGLDFYALYVGSNQTNKTTGYSNIQIQAVGDQTTVTELTGQKIVVYDATSRNTGIDITIGGGLTGNTVGLQINSNNTVNSSTHDGIFGTLSGDHGDGLGVKKGSSFNINGICEETYGYYTAIQEGTITNEAFTGVIGGNTGNSYGVKISNSNTNTGGSDIQTGGEFTVNGIGVSTSTIKYGLNVVVQNDALENYGIKISSTGAGTNYAVFTNEGTSIFNNNQITTSDFNIKGGTDSGLFYVSATNDTVGVGTSTPTRKLDVVGDYQFYHDPNVELTGAVTVEGYGDIVYFGGGGSSFSAGDLVYLDSAGDWQQANASSSGTSTQMLAIALGSVVSDGMLVKGYVYNSGWGPWTVGVPLYIRSAAGALNSVPPSSAGEVVRIVGYCVDVTDGYRIYFNPDNTWIEI